MGTWPKMKDRNTSEALRRSVGHNTILTTPMVTDTATTARREDMEKDTEKDILALLVVLEKAIIMAKREDMDMVATMVRRADTEKDILALLAAPVLLGPRV